MLKRFTSFAIFGFIISLFVAMATIDAYENFGDQIEVAETEPEIETN